VRRVPDACADVKLQAAAAALRVTAVTAYAGTIRYDLLAGSCRQMKRRKMGKFTRWGACFAGAALMAVCGSTLGQRLGLQGVAQWPVIGFALGVLLLSQVGVWTLAVRLQALERAVAGRADHATIGVNKH
jgi:hypothetical protein